VVGFDSGAGEGADVGAGEGADVGAGASANASAGPDALVPDGWQPIRVNVVAPLPRREVLDGLRVVWRREAGHVLTVAIAG
jgi:hypothetical protein